MKSNSRSENARNEARDSQGRFESSNKKQQGTHSSHSGSTRGSYAENGPRDEHGRLQPKNQQGSHSSSKTTSKTDGRANNGKNEARDADGRFTSKK